MTHMKIIGTPLYQWEIGRQLQIIPIRGMTVDFVHFSNEGDAEALSVQPKEIDGIIVADIPDIFLQSGRNLVVYTVNTPNGGCVETIRDCVFPVRKRAKPSDYVCTEPEKMTWKSLDERIKALEENVDPAAVAAAVESYMAEHPVVESDPTVPEWAKAKDRPSYTAQDVGALPADTEIPVVPTKVSAFENDKGYLTEQNLSGYAKSEDIPTKPSDIGAQPAGNYATKDEIPTTLPNPHKLTFSGAVNAEYDGSEAVEVVIPQGGGGGGKMRHLGRFETQEDVAWFEIGVDSSGNAFNLSSVVVCGVLMPNAGAKKGWSKPVCNGVHIATSLPSTMDLGERTLGVAFRFDLRCTGDRILLDECATGPSSNTATWNILNNRQSLGDVPYRFSASAIQSVGMVSLHEGGIGAGTYIDVWGVDA